MKRKIMFISEHASPLASLGGADSGGQNVYVDKLSKELVGLGYEVDIFTRKDDPDLPEIIDCLNQIRIINVKAGPEKPVKKERMLPFMDEFTKYILKFIKKEKIEYKLIHANFFMSGLVAAQIKKEKNIPFVITFHALGKIRKIYQGENDQFPLEREEIETRIIKEADQIIAECPQDKTDLIAHYQAEKEIISVIPCGFDPYELYPVNKVWARKLLNLPLNEKIVLQLGRIVPRKGIENAIKAFALLKKNSKIKARLLIVGGESDNPNPRKTPELGRLMEISKKEGVRKQIDFLGRKQRQELKNYYSAADIFVTTPWYEPFGITPLEAMACGTPVIGSNVGGIRYSVVNGKTGYLVEPEDHVNLAAKLQYLAENELVADSMGKEGFKRVNQYFRWSLIAQQIASLYEKVIALKKDANKENYFQIIGSNFESLLNSLNQSKEELLMPITNSARLIISVIKIGNKMYFCGNGGSAAAAEHFVTELEGHFLLKDRPPLPAISLTTDSALLTALSNDFSFTEIFSRQIDSLGKKGDILAVFSTSGNSENIINALKKAKEKNMFTLGFLGNKGGRAKYWCDESVVVPSENTQRIQEIHDLTVHIICEIVEKELFGTLNLRLPVSSLAAEENRQISLEISKRRQL